jgi:U3 small nucleolar ribonucleoprotein protein IMP3
LGHFYSFAPGGSMRKLKHHEQKLLKKVNFLQWKNEHNLREVQVMRRYHIQDRDDYKKYNKLCGGITQLVATLKRLDAQDSTRIDITDQLLNK